MTLRDILLAGILCMLPAAVAADEPVDPFELTVEENLTPPRFSKKQTEAMRQHMQSVASELQRHKYNVAKSHEGLVVTVSIPCARLFAANDSNTLLPQAEALLRPLLSYAAKPDSYRIVISVHSDNTGSEQYRNALTEARANIICDFFEKNAPEAEAAQSVIPYGMGHDEALVNDNSIANRSKNRRVEISIVPVK